MKLNKITALITIPLMAMSLHVQAKDMRIGIGVPESHFEFVAMKKFEKHIEDNTEIDVEVYPSNQLGSDLEALEQVKFNATQMNLPSPAVLGNIVKDF